MELSTSLRKKHQIQQQKQQKEILTCDRKDLKARPQIEFNLGEEPATQMTSLILGGT